MNRQQGHVVSLTLLVVSMACMSAGNDGGVAEEFSAEVESLCNQIRQTASIRCQACNGSAGADFLFGQHEQPEEVLLRCTSCRKILHRRCLEGHACSHNYAARLRSCAARVRNYLAQRDSIHEEAANYVWEERQQIYERCAQQRRGAPDGFQNHDHWVQSYLDEDGAAQSIFNALKEGWVQRLRNPNARQLSLDQIIENVSDLPGDNCAICLNNLVAHTIIGDNREIVHNNRCRHELCRLCADSLARHGSGYYGHRPALCPSCRQEGGTWERACYRSGEGFLRSELRPGYEEDDRVLRCAARADLYRQACLLLAAPHQREQERQQRAAEQHQREQERQQRVYEQQRLLYEMRKASLSCMAISAIAVAVFPANATFFGTAIGYGVVAGTGSVVAHCMLHYKKAEVAAIERRRAL